MPKVYPFTVVADLPPELSPLREISRNLWWSWDPNARNLFVRTSERHLAGNRNAVELVNSLSREEIAGLMQNDSYRTQLVEVQQALAAYQNKVSWWNEHGAKEYPNCIIAYFCAEFGLHQSLPIYSGGLGVLAGDYLKAASDLGMPVVGLGFLYHEGYFHQYLNADGWQQESNPNIDITTLPISLLRDETGRARRVSVSILGKEVAIQAWQVDVGRNRLFLLDTNIEDNELGARHITARLYGGDEHLRIQQEIVLGIGGVRLLRALGIDPTIFHMNEGHSAFLGLEQIRERITRSGIDFDTALESIKDLNLFTTHTPVPAGNDAFPPQVIELYLNHFAAELGISMETLLGLGRINQTNTHEAFSMTVLALRTSTRSNGVSELHGQISRKLWSALWPEVPLEEVPIGHVTNGVHTATWASRDIMELFDRYLGPNWQDQFHRKEPWIKMSQIPDTELWRIISRKRALLVALCRERLQRQLRRRGAGRAELSSAAEILNPEALTIGFARRFASYKRGSLILRDMDRLVRILLDEGRPVQFIFAGKSHPADRGGKEIIAALIHAARRTELRHRFVFLEDYDMGIARNLVQGVDVWLNNPRRPLEASGTSGMKVAINGGLNLSVLDGWWCEAFDGFNGWCIGGGEEYQDQNYQDEVESRSIYDLLEREIIPTFYDRSGDGLPKRWLELVKNSMRTIIPAFSAARMAQDYATGFYMPLLERQRQAQPAELREIREVVDKKKRFREHWHAIEIKSVETQGIEHIDVGGTLVISAIVRVGPFSTEDLAVQAVFGHLDAQDRIHEADITRLNQPERISDDGIYRFTGLIRADRAGRHGFSVRVVPRIRGEACVTEPGLIHWSTK